ncbi:hypothetical protein [Caproiciproducens sp. MSJ-32]|uniref:hypothetical protein n=1 Tax=Caproiciproducens sp. MSJ-32 TaxID=2841527 RepID=UPI001C107A0C|nr:hypothetical protein [Caproiciproducens sp. MSJ-32]MBU5455637.1 hypothetical protein [Caproiciproducens sp. MSJ-32]
MRIRKKKRGSTFVIVIVVMAIIFTMGTTILAVTANDYKMRIAQSRKLQNLYEADSGLDIVENIIIKTSQEAIKYADKEVKELLADLEEEDKSKEEINEFFKEKFYEFLTVMNKQTIDLDGRREIVDILEYLILEKQYIKSVLESGELVFEDAVDPAEDYFILEIPENGYVFNANGISVTVNSTFETAEGELRNRKTVSTTFTVSAPEYNSEITAIKIYPVFDGKALTADGNMEVKDGSLTINGDAWIKGNDYALENNPAYSFDKYKGGIKLEMTNFIMNGNLYTANTFHLSNNARSTVNGNLYAQNVYVGKSINSISSVNNHVTIKENVIVNNDLAFNASKSSITIENNFYGINDKTTEVTTADKALNSSSIIVNSLDLDNSTEAVIKVEKDSYIMGVAYIDATDAAGNKYQTGESVAVKGNYLAYTDVKDFEEGYVLKYYSPLQLLESKNGDSSPAMKADYFAQYFSDENRERNYNFNDGKVKLKGKVKSVGASVKDSRGEIQRANISPEDLEIIENQQKEYARNVFAMGDITGLGDTLYQDQTVKRTVSNQINFDEIRNIDMENINEDNGRVILKAKVNESDKIKITNGQLEGTSDIIEKGLIITNCDIIIEGSFNFTGNIITAGNIIFQGEGEKNITYDPQVIRNIIALNTDSLKDIFEPSTNSRVEVKVRASAEAYSADKFLKKSLWKIIK